MSLSTYQVMNGYIEILRDTPRLMHRTDGSVLLASTFVKELLKMDISEDDVVDAVEKRWRKLGGFVNFVRSHLVIRVKLELYIGLQFSALMSWNFVCLTDICSGKYLCETLVPSCDQR